MEVVTIIPTSIIIISKDSIMTKCLQDYLEFIITLTHIPGSFFGNTHVKIFTELTGCTPINEYKEDNIIKYKQHRFWVNKINNTLECINYPHYIKSTKTNVTNITID